MNYKDKISLKVTQASLNQTALDWPRNMSNIFAAINNAVEEKSDILALEELAITGYEANDEFQRTDNDRILASLDDIAAYAKALDENLIISVGHPWRVQTRNVKIDPLMDSFEQVKNPLYDRLNLPFIVQTIITNGSIIGMTAKQNLFNDERGYEKRYFNEWSIAAANEAGGLYGTIDVSLDETGGRIVPFGRPLIHVTDKENSFNLAQAICEEKWVAAKYDGHPYNDSRYEENNIIPSISNYLGSKDGLVLMIANASPPSPDKNDKHVHLNNLASQYSNLVIDTDGLGSSGSTFAQYGHKIIVQNNKLLSQGKRMDFGRVSTHTSIVGISNAPKFTQENTHGTILHRFGNNGSDPKTNIAYENNKDDAWDSPNNPNRHYEEVIRYTAFWLFDYMRKTGHKGIMEALSGGADSAFNSTIVSVMVNLGMHDLGVEKFCDELKLSNKQDILDAEKFGGIKAAIDCCLKESLTGIYMGTSNSSSDTYEAARFLMEGGTDPQTGEEIEGIGGKFMNRNVQDLIDFYSIIYAIEDTTTIEPNLKHRMLTEFADYLHTSPHSSSEEERIATAERLKAKYPQIHDLVTATDGVAYENIQARARQALIMLFANKENKMPVANPNLDEARNAYSTFGGDLHSGTINLNNHLPKGYSLKIMNYLYEHGLHGVMKPVKSLGSVLRNKPTAELQPKNNEGIVVQSDEEAMQRNFAQMDQISKYMLYQKKVTENGERRLNISEIFDLCKENEIFESVTENRLYNMLRVSYNSWSMAQHKIHGAPLGPTFGSNVDHQTSQRTPNIHGNSKDELTILGIDLMYKWAEQDNLGWDQNNKEILNKRAWQDENFINQFSSHVWSGSDDMHYNLARLYEEVKEKGWNELFEPLPMNHPINIIQRASLRL